MDDSGIKDKVVFNSGSIPEDGAMVEIDYRHSYESVLAYSANLTTVELATLAVSNDTGAIAADLTTSSVSIALADFIAGTDLVLIGNTIPGSSTQLSASPLSGSVVAMQGANSCTEGSGLVVSGSEIDFSGCSTADPSAAWVVSYQYVAEHRLAYSLQDELADYNGQAKAWIVSVNGTPTVNYTLNDNDTFSFSTLPISALLEIVIYVFPDRD